MSARCSAVPAWPLRWSVCALDAPAHAEAIKVGVGTSAGGNLYLALDRGYFAAEGLEVEFHALPRGGRACRRRARVAGSIDFGATGVAPAALYSLGGQGVVRRSSPSSLRETPGFQFLTVVESNQAFAAGWTALKDIGGHSVAVPQIGFAVALQRPAPHRREIRRRSQDRARATGAVGAEHDLGRDRRPG